MESKELFDLMLKPFYSVDRLEPSKRDGRVDLDEWWVGLSIPNKEHIAGKCTGRKVCYPECSSVWKSLTDEKKKRIHDHCTDKHGMVHVEWYEGKTYSY